MVFRNCSVMHCAFFMLLGGMLPASSGCVLSRKVRNVGLRQEEPRFDGTAFAPLVEAYADPEHRRLQLKYRVLVGKQQQTRWLCLGRDQVARLVERMEQEGGVYIEQGVEHNRIVIDDEALARFVHARPRWDVRDMRRLTPYPHVESCELRAAPHLAVGKRDVEGRAYPVVVFPMEMAATQQPDRVVVAFPFERTYRTTGGTAAQVLLPAAAVADVVVTPAVYLKEWVVFLHSFE